MGAPLAATDDTHADVISVVLYRDGPALRLSAAPVNGAIPQQPTARPNVAAGQLRAPAQLARPAHDSAAQAGPALAPPPPPPNQWCARVITADGRLLARRCGEPMRSVHLAPRLAGGDDDAGHAAPQRAPHHGALHHPKSAHGRARQATLRWRLPWQAGARLQVSGDGQNLTWAQR